MSSISDPGRPSRRDRRRAQKLVETAFSERRLTAADQALRIQRITAAHTRGDLAMITRDLLAPTTLSLGRAIEPTTLSSMRVGGTLPSGATLDLTTIGRKVRLIAIITMVCLLGFCGLGLAAVIPGMVRSMDALPTPAVPGATTGARDDADQPPSPAVTLHSAAGWKQLVTAIEEASGTTSIYDAVIYPEYASVALDSDGAAERRFYRNGAWQDAVSVRTPAVGSLVDLGAIDPDLIGRLPGETARHFNIDKPIGSYLIINAIRNEPRIMVYVQTDVDAQYRAYSLTGEPLD